LPKFPWRYIAQAAPAAGSPPRRRTASRL